MGRFVKFEENDDGTTSATLQLVEDGEILYALIPFSFDTIANGLVTKGQVAKESVFIPNEVDI